MRYELAAPVPAPPLRDHLPMGDDRVAVTSRWIDVDGRPIIPVSAEMHATRIPAALWDEVLRRARAGGVTHVATYAIWNHHEPVEGELSFEGDLDLRRFLLTARRHGLELVLRLGPYAHGEVRHGGLPDWLLEEALVPRSDDPAYLAHATRWFGAIAEQVRGIPFFALQVENELYDDPAHLLTLKRLAREAGLDAPLWTGTAWGGAHLPPDELLPVFAGYSEAFWIEADAGFDAASASNFYPSLERDEVGVGADTRDAALMPSNLNLERYPYATCELGGGMVSAYHRRPYAAPRDVAALALAKLGSGSVWQGYYMYADGRNPRRGLQESHASGGRNDFPELGYDFGAPLAVDGARRESWARLRLQHHLLASFGSTLATMPAVLPEDAPTVPDTSSLRWSVRSDGTSGFLVVVNHQPGVELPEHRDAVFAIRLAGDVIELPPVGIPAGAAFVWPLRLPVGEALLEWATAQPVTVVDWQGAPLLVLAETPGVEARLAWAAGSDADAVAAPGGSGPGRWSVVTAGGRTLARVLVLTEPDALRLAVDDGALVLEEADGSTSRLGEDGWTRVPGAPHPQLPAVQLRELRSAGEAPAPTRGGPLGRASIPRDWSGAWAAELSWGDAPGASLVVDWEGDVARLWHDDRLVSDALFTGREWRIGAAELAGATRVRLEILPWHPDARVHVALGRPDGLGVRAARLELP